MSGQVPQPKVIRCMKRVGVGEGGGEGGGVWGWLIRMTGDLIRAASWAITFSPTPKNWGASSLPKKLSCAELSTALPYYFIV